MNDCSILFNTLITGEAELGATGTTPSGLHFTYSVSEPSTGDRALGMYTVALPFITSTHLLALPKQTKEMYSFVDVPQSLNPVQLEGDYVDYFSLYAGQNQQVESRVMLNPATMEFSIDFCSTYAWEVADETLSFLSPESLPNLHIVDSFIQMITPAAAPIAETPINDRPQTFEQLSPDATKLLCPVCSVALHNGKSWIACPDGHGYLIAASDLIKTRQHMDDMSKAMEATVGAKPKVITKISITPHGDLKCPNDGVLLQKSPYQETSAFLYICPSCIYRWIDGQDLDTILGQYRNDSEDQVDDSSDELPSHDSVWNQDVETQFYLHL